MADPILDKARAADEPTAS